MSREKIYPDHEALVALGFQHLHIGAGDDPRDYFYVKSLNNDESMWAGKVDLALDAYFDWSLALDSGKDLEVIPLNFQSLDEVRLFIEVFTRRNNHAFSFLNDLI